MLAFSPNITFEFRQPSTSTSQPSTSLQRPINRLQHIPAHILTNKPVALIGVYAVGKKNKYELFHGVVPDPDAGEAGMTEGFR